MSEQPAVILKRAELIIIIMIRFELNTSQLFLTYPECNESKEDLLEALETKFGEHGIERYCIAQELHKNGMPHLHAYIKLRKAYHTRNSRDFDFNGHHGNYQGCRSAKNVIKYCSKEEDFIANFDVASETNKKGSTRKTIGEEILKGKTLEEMVLQNPQLLFGYLRLKQDIAEFKTDTDKTAVPDLPDEIPNPWGARIRVDTDNKKCHGWFYSKAPNRGKTSCVIKPLVEQYGAYYYSPDSMYHTITKKTRIIVMDELRMGAIKVEKLNLICDGFAKFRILYKGEISLDEKPLVVICSNFSIKEVFPNDYIFVEARFIEYCAD